MSEDRIRKLKSLKDNDEDRRIDNLKELATSELELLPDYLKLDYQEFLEEFSAQISTLSDLIDVGISINNIDKISEEFSHISSIQPYIENLTNTIKAIKQPSATKETDIKTLLESVPKSVQVEWINKKDAKKITKSFDDLIKAVKENRVSQNPGDYVPIRRVMKVGNQLMWDDSFYTGGGGGGSNIPTKNGSVPVVNPDGSNIGGSGTVTNDGTFATPGKQDTGNTSLGSIDINIGAKADTVASSDTGTFSLIALTKRIAQWLTSANGYLQSLATGQSDKSQFTKLTDGTDTALITASGEQNVLESNSAGIKSDTAAIAAKDFATQTTLATRLSESDFDTKIGSLTETAPVTDTASSGLNGRLQRIAQRLTSIIALLPGSLGQKARASSFAVTLSSEDITAITPPAAITNYAQETGGNLATIQTTLALIKTKTDNIDVALSTRTKPADAQHTIIDSGTVSATQGTSPWVISGTTDPTTPTTVRYGQKTVAVTNTAVQLDTGAGIAFVVQALAGNSGNVVVGDISVITANGFQLQPGQATGIAISNINKLYVNGTSGDGVCWIGS